MDIYLRNCELIFHSLECFELRKINIETNENDDFFFQSEKISIKEREG